MNVKKISMLGVIIVILGALYSCATMNNTQVNYVNFYRDDYYLRLKEKNQLKIVDKYILTSYLSVNKETKNPDNFLKIINTYSDNDMYSTFKKYYNSEMKKENIKYDISIDIIRKEKGYITYYGHDVECCIVTNKVQYVKYDINNTEYYNLIFIHNSNKQLQLVGFIQLDNIDNILKENSDI